MKTYLLLGLIILSLTIPLHANTEQQVKVILKLYDLDGKPLRFMNGYAKIGPRDCPELGFKVTNSTITINVPSKCAKSPWILTYYGKNSNGKAFFAVNILNLTWVNNTTVILEGKVNIKPLLIRIVSLRDAGLPSAIVSLGDPTFTFERVHTNASGYVWIDLLARKDIDITVFWPPRTAYEGLIPKPQARIKTLDLVNYTNYTVKLNYNLSTINPIKVVNNQGQPGGYTWVKLCDKLMRTCSKPYLLTMENATFNITLNDILKYENVLVYYITLNNRLPDMGFDIIEVAEKGIIKVRMHYVKAYTSRNKVRVHLAIPAKAPVYGTSVIVSNGSWIPIYFETWSGLYHRWEKTYVGVSVLEPNTTLWTEGLQGTIELETGYSELKGSWLKIYVTGLEPSKASILISVNKGKKWKQVSTSIKAYPDKWVIVADRYDLLNVDKGVVLDVRGSIKVNGSSFIAFWVRGVHPYKMLLLGQQAETTTTSTGLATPSTIQQTRPSTTQPASTTSTPATSPTSTAPTISNTITEETSTISQGQEFPWWILVIMVLIIVLVAVLVAKRRTKIRKQGERPS